MEQCAACSAQGVELTIIIDMFGNEGAVCTPCKQNLEDNTCIGCGS